MFLGWILVEIIAATFHVDFTQLNAAISGIFVSVGFEGLTQLDRSSILGAKEKVALKYLCTLIKDLEKKHRRDEWNTTFQRDRDLVVRAVIQPAFDLGLQADYVLEVIGRYAHFRGRRMKRRKGTLVDHWMPRYARFRWRSKWPMRDLGDTFRSYSCLIASVLPADENVRVILSNAMAKFRKRRGIRELQNTGQDFCWPLSDGYMDLYETLKTASMCNDGSWKRDSLRRERKDRK